MDDFDDPESLLMQNSFDFTRLDTQARHHSMIQKLDNSIWGTHFMYNDFSLESSVRYPTAPSKMKIFVTGASGFIGKALVQELLSNGHQVLALARTDVAAIALAATGAQVHLGSLEDLESLKAGARQSDGVIHLGFVKDLSDFEGANKTDREAIRAMGEAIEGTGKPLVIASGTLGVSVGKLATEDTEPQRDLPVSVRYEAADLVYELAREKNIRGIVVRLSAVVHGEGDHGFVPALSGLAKKNGVGTYVGDGSARWPAVHKRDAARLFRLAVEKGEKGATYNAAAEEGVKVKDICEMIGKKLGMGVEDKEVKEAEKTMGLLAHFVSMDGPTSSEKTRKELGWTPGEVTLLEDMENYPW